MTVVTSYLLILANLLAGLSMAAVPANSGDRPTPRTHQQRTLQSKPIRVNGWIRGRKPLRRLEKNNCPWWFTSKPRGERPCRRMEAEVLQQHDVKLLLGNSIVGVRLDADRNRALIDEFKIETLRRNSSLLPMALNLPLLSGRKEIRIHRSPRPDFGVEKMVEVRKVAFEEKSDTPADSGSATDQNAPGDPIVPDRPQRRKSWDSEDFRRSPEDNLMEAGSGLRRELSGSRVLSAVRR